MTPPSLNRRSFAVAAGALAAATGARAQAPADDLGVSRASAAIRQTVVFKASSARVYAALTDPLVFAKVVELSGAVRSMALAATPTVISPEAGGAFSLFGGYITGRQLELTPAVRLIQAWRSNSWAPHWYSIARFELTDGPGGATLVFDHTGFPDDEAQSLARGWRAHYWEPLAKVLAGQG